MLMCTSDAIYTMCHAQEWAEKHTFQPLQKETIAANLMICIYINRSTGSTPPDTENLSLKKFLKQCYTTAPPCGIMR